MGHKFETPVLHKRLYFSSSVLGFLFYFINVLHLLKDLMQLMVGARSIPGLCCEIWGLSAIWGSGYLCTECLASAIEVKKI